MQYMHIQTSLCTKGSFHENGQCNYIKILFFSLRLLHGDFMIRIMKVLLKYCMATKCVNLNIDLSLICTNLIVLT